jgi:glutathione S-transferase
MGSSEPQPLEGKQMSDSYRVADIPFFQVVFVLEELQKFCTIVSFKFHNVKKKPFNDPNGHVPAIGVPHADLVLRESGAIIQHPIEQYDTDKTLTYTTLEKHRLHFQMSGWGHTGERGLVSFPARYLQ